MPADDVVVPLTVARPGSHVVAGTPVQVDIDGHRVRLRWEYGSDEVQLVASAIRPTSGPQAVIRTANRRALQRERQDELERRSRVTRDEIRRAFGWPVAGQGTRRARVSLDISPAGYVLDISPTGYVVVPIGGADRLQTIRPGVGVVTFNQVPASATGRIVVSAEILAGGVFRADVQIGTYAAERFLRVPFVDIDAACRDVAASFRSDDTAEARAIVERRQREPEERERHRRLAREDREQLARVRADRPMYFYGGGWDSVPDPLLRTRFQEIASDLLRAGERKPPVPDAPAPPPTLVHKGRKYDLDDDE